MSSVLQVVIQREMVKKDLTCIWFYSYIQLCKKWGVEPKKIEKAGLNVLGSIGMYQAGNTK